MGAPMGAGKFSVAGEKWGNLTGLAAHAAANLKKLGWLDAVHFSLLSVR